MCFCDLPLVVLLGSVFGAFGARGGGGRDIVWGVYLLHATPVIYSTWYTTRVLFMSSLSRAWYMERFVVMRRGSRVFVKTNVDFLSQCSLVVSCGMSLERFLGYTVAPVCM